MVETEIATLISTIGFPAAMCIWFMFRTEKIISNNTMAMVEVRDTMNFCPKRKK